MLKPRVTVWAIYSCADATGHRELEYICASEFLARKVLEEIRKEENFDEDIYEDGLYIAGPAGYYQAESATVWTENPELDPYVEPIIRKARQ